MAIYVPTSPYYNINFAVGEQRASVTVMPGQSDSADQVEAVDAVRALLQPVIDGTYVSTSCVYEISDEDIIDDSSVRMQPARFNFIETSDETGDRVTIFVPWYKGVGGQQAKKTLGQSMATALSGDRIQYKFRS